MIKTIIDNTTTKRAQTLTLIRIQERENIRHDNYDSNSVNIPIHSLSKSNNQKLFEKEWGKRLIRIFKKCYRNLYKCQSKVDK